MEQIKRCFDKLKILLQKEIDKRESDDYEPIDDDNEMDIETLTELSELLEDFTEDINEIQ